MAREKLPDGVGELPAPAPDALPVSTSAYRLVDTDELAPVVHVPLTGRDYELAKLTESQAEQLHTLGWPHIEKV